MRHRHFIQIPTEIIVLLKEAVLTWQSLCLFDIYLFAPSMDSYLGNTTCQSILEVLKHNFTSVELIQICVPVQFKCFDCLCGVMAEVAALPLYTA